MGISKLLAGVSLLVLACFQLLKKRNVLLELRHQQSRTKIRENLQLKVRQNTS